ncbi:IS256 family transposase [Alicyclobacillus fastidiosus]|uniref:IS256 family transposase n=1 Tax=Alicyclobacillus fastidiosus TaxID=392011 RepID=UPI0023B803FB|nr:IS256 family transposase [Alicyclobacillus fastidiosus]WEH12048.1 IS256 family transposase [Alicyclobacillus fastidiosus]
MAYMDKIALLDLIRKIGLEDGDVDFLKEGLKILTQAVMDVEVSSLIGAERYERSEKRSNSRNGHREREWDTRVGTIDLQIPKLRKGGYFPSILEPRRKAEKALLAVVQEAYVHGVSTRKVDELVESLGIQGISKSEVSRICKELDDVVQSFKNRPLEGAYPYVWLDATFPKVREGGRVQSMAFVIAIGVRDTGEREVLGFDIGTSEDGSFWLTFIRSLVARGLSGVQLAISDAHEGLRNAIGSALTGATWQRCRVHTMRNILSQVPRASQQMVSSIVRTIFAQPTQETAKQQLAVVLEQLQAKFPKAMNVLERAEEDVLAYMAFPKEHWKQICSTNPLERLNRELRRRFDVVGIFPNRDSVVRLGGAILQEQNDEWVVARRYFSRESMAKLTGTDEQQLLAPTSVLHK